MVGDEGGRRRQPAVTGAYGETVAAGWHAAAGVVYQPLAAALVAASPIELAGARVLDVGTGAGAAAAVAHAVGASVIAVDLSAVMLCATPGVAWPRAAADVQTLPFRSGVFHVAIAAFVVNHVDPAGALAEMGRVVRPGGVVLASSWMRGSDPVKASIDAVLADHGWEPPGWYVRMKSVTDEVAGDPDRLALAAASAGLVDITAAVHEEPLGAGDAAAVVRYRLATPHIAPWAAGLNMSAMRAVTAQAERLVGPIVDDWHPAAILLTARTPGRYDRR